MSERQRDDIVRYYLVNGALFLLILALCSWIRFTIVLTDEVHALRVALVSQLTALNSVVQTNGNRMDMRGQDIAIALRTFGKRVDSNITDTRATIQKVGVSAQAATVQQMKETREVLNDKLDQATQNLAVVAAKAEEPDKPVQVNIPPAVVIPPAQIKKEAEKPQEKTERDPPKKHGFWKRILPPWK